MSHTTARCSGNVSMPGEDETLDRKDERLNPQEQGMHEPDGIHPVQDQNALWLMSGEEARSRWLLL